MKKRLAKLVDVKSIITIALTLVFTYLSIIGRIGEAQVLTIFTTVIGFYFGTQSEKKNKESDENVKQ